MQTNDPLLAATARTVNVSSVGTGMISVVVPVFNGARTLEELCSRVAVVMAAMNWSYELLFVDDASTDGSWEVISRLHLQNKNRIRGFRLARNSGQQAATLCGLLRASGTWIVTLDDDCEHPPEDIPALLEAAQRSAADIVYGVRPNRQHGLAQKACRGLFRYILRGIAPGYPGGSSFRLIRTSLITLLPEERHPWIFVDASLSMVTDRFASVPVSQAPVRPGKSRYSFTQLLSLALTLLFVYSIIPMRLMIWSGLLASAVSFGLGIYFLFRKLTVGAPLGFSALIVTLTFTSGVVLLSLGVLSEYLSRIYIIQTGRKAFIIKTRLV